MNVQMMKSLYEEHRKKIHQKYCSMHVEVVTVKISSEPDLKYIPFGVSGVSTTVITLFSHYCNEKDAYQRNILVPKH